MVLQLTVAIKELAEYGQEVRAAVAPAISRRPVVGIVHVVSIAALADPALRSPPPAYAPPPGMRTVGTSTVSRLRARADGRWCVVASQSSRPVHAAVPSEIHCLRPLMTQALPCRSGSDHPHPRTGIRLGEGKTGGRLALEQGGEKAFLVNRTEKEVHDVRAVDK